MSMTIELFSQDFSTVLLTTSSYPAAEQFLRDSGKDWLPMRVQWEGVAGARWSGRLECKSGDIEPHQDIEYLKKLVNP